MQGARQHDVEDGVDPDILTHEGIKIKTTTCTTTGVGIARLQESCSKRLVCPGLRCAHCMGRFACSGILDGPPLRFLRLPSQDPRYINEAAVGCEPVIMKESRSNWP